MAHAVRMPKPGQMTEECTLSLWLKHEGEPVTKGDILFEIETDKATMEVESFHDGVLLRQLVGEGDTVPVNAICAWIGSPDEDLPDEGTPARAEVLPPASVPPPESAPAPPQSPAGAPIEGPSDLASPPESPAGRGAVSPRANRLAAAAGLDARAIAGTGPGGRVVERDVKAAIIVRGDRIRQVAVAGVAVPGVAATGASDAPVGPGSSLDEEAPRPLSRMRRVIAERLTQSVITIPHFTVTASVDVTRLLALRDELKEGGTNLTVTDFVLAATAQSLAEYQDVNSRTDGILVWPRRRVHLGLAVSVPSGLVVPVIRDADRIGLVELHNRAAALAAAARAGTLGVDDMTGSTFTVSNLGMFGVDEFSAIINPGESAILAVASAIPTPVALGGGITVRTIMRLTLSADHRLVDGELGARFLNAIRRRLEDADGIRDGLTNSWD